MKMRLISLFFILIMAVSVCGCINEDDSGGNTANITDPAPTTEAPTTTAAPTTTPAPTTAAPTTTPAPTTTAAPTTTPAPTTAAPQKTGISLDEVFSWDLDFEIYGDPIIYKDTLYYLIQISEETSQYWGVYDMDVYSILYGTFDYHSAQGDNWIRLFSGGALYVPVDDNDYWGYIVDLDTMKSKDLTLKSLEDYSNDWGTYAMRSGSYTQVYSRNVATGKSYVLTSTSTNKSSPAISGNYVVYCEYVGSWDLMYATKTGGVLGSLSSMDGDEVDPQVDNTHVIFGLEDGAVTELYYTQIGSTAAPVKLCDDVGRYYLNGGMILYYDNGRARWSIISLEGPRLYKYNFTQWYAGADAPVAIDSKWVFINGDMFEISVS